MRVKTKDRRFDYRGQMKGKKGGYSYRLQKDEKRREEEDKKYAEWVQNRDVDNIGLLYE